MRYFFVLITCCASAFEFSKIWQPFKWHTASNLENRLEEEINHNEGRFLTIFGYPRKCEYNGNYHSCTFSLACWWVGGYSRPGCGGNPWMVACCVVRNIQNVPNKFEQATLEKSLQTGKKSVPVPILEKRRDYTKNEKCGLSADRILQKRIIGGNPASFGQFPWQVYLKISSYQCGGVLVSPRFVATAAHCIIRAKLTDIAVYLGELDTQDTGKVLELSPVERHKVKRKIIHPEFALRFTQPDRYDLGLLELTRTAGTQFHISPICLPEHGAKVEGEKGVIAGWGKIKPSKDLTGTNVLQSTTVPILDIKECMSWHQEKQIHVELYEEMLCAGHKDGLKDACLGDSGGPLIVLINGRWTLAGIISAGFGCGEPNQPGIYHSVSVTADWIRSIITL